jgi:hypothetical protein
MWLGGLILKVLAQTLHHLKLGERVTGVVL